MTRYDFSNKPFRIRSRPQFRRLRNLVRTKFYVCIARQYSRISSNIAVSNAHTGVQASALNAIHSYFSILAREAKKMVGEINRERRITAHQRRTLLGQVRSIALMITKAFWRTIPQNHQAHYHSFLPQALKSILPTPPAPKLDQAWGTGGGSTEIWMKYPDGSIVSKSSGALREDLAKYVVVPFLVKLFTGKKFVGGPTVN